MTDRIKALIAKYKYPLLIVAIGIGIMLLPAGKTQQTAENRDLRLESILSCTAGVGEAHVLISESGVVVVCSGAEDARIRLDILHAVNSYTGFSSDKVTILKISS